MAVLRPAKGRLRRTRIDLRVEFLSVPIAWPVGTVMFRPAGWLRKRLDKDFRPPWTPQEWALEPLNGWPWATASASILARPPDRASPDPAAAVIGHVADAIAVARLYQRACVPGISLERQTFGLVGTMGGHLEAIWRSDHRGVTGVQARREGVIGGFTFSREMIRGFRSRPAFAFLDDALRATDAAVGSWQQRAIASVRALHLAGPTQPQPLRIALQAVALEALLGDDPPADPRTFRGQAHPVAQRGAFITCPVDGARLEPGGTACVCLTGTSKAISSHPEQASRRPDYWDWPCTQYWHVREIFSARNEAMHDARDQFPARTTGTFQYRIDEVILAALDWVVATGASGLGDLDAAMKRLPVRP